MGPNPGKLWLFLFTSFELIFLLQDIVEDITAGITADVQKYIISLVPVGIAAPAINATLGATDRNVCSSKRCKFDFERIEEMLALYYDLYITAKNLLTDGYGEAQICSNLTISKIVPTTIYNIILYGGYEVPL